MQHRLLPPIPCNPAFGFVSSLPHQVNPSIAAQNLPPILLTRIPPSSTVSTVSVNSLSTTKQPLRKVLPSQLRCMALLLCFLPSADKKNYPHFPVLCRPFTTCHEARSAQYHQPHALSTLCMKPLMLSFAPRLAWKRARPCLITLNFLARSPFQILSQISFSIAAPSMGHFYLLTYGI